MGTASCPTCCNISASTTRSTAATSKTLVRTSRTAWRVRRRCCSGVAAAVVGVAVAVAVGGISSGISLAMYTRKDEVPRFWRDRHNSARPSFFLCIRFRPSHQILHCLHWTGPLSPGIRRSDRGAGSGLYARNNAPPGGFGAPVSSVRVSCIIHRSMSMRILIRSSTSTPTRRSARTRLQNLLLPS